MTKGLRYQTGGTLPPGSPLYIIRRADSELLRLCREGEFCDVLTSRQMGKSSLMVRTAQTLMAEGFSCALIDLTCIGTNASDDAWYLGILDAIASAVTPKTDLLTWWGNHQYLGVSQRFFCYVEEVLLVEIDCPIVVFVDEIDTSLSLSYADDFFAAIRAFYNARAINPAFQRLSFVLIGVATPNELIHDEARTPFNIGKRVELTDFNIEEAQPLAAGLAGNDDTRRQTLARIIDWTSGQPYLTQRLAELASQAQAAPNDVDAIATTELLGAKGRADVHFQFLAKMLRHAPAPEKEELFETALGALKGKPIECVDQSPIHNRLRLAGLLKRVDGKLRYRNRLYRHIFDASWIKANRPSFWTKTNKRLAVSLGITMLIATLSIYVAVLFAEQKSALETALHENHEKTAALQSALADNQAKQQALENSTEEAVNAKNEALVAREYANKATPVAKEHAAKAAAVGVAIRDRNLAVQRGKRKPKPFRHGQKNSRPTPASKAKLPQRLASCSPDTR